MVTKGISLLPTTPANPFSLEDKLCLILAYATSLSGEFWISVWIFPSELSKRFEWFGKRLEYLLDIFRRIGYDDWLCQTSYFHSCWNGNVATLRGSNCQAIYGGSWWQSLEANRSNNGFTKWLQICLKTVGQSFHPLLSWKFRDAQSAVWLLRLGIYSAVKFIFLSMR